MDKGSLGLGLGLGLGFPKPMFFQGSLPKRRRTTSNQKCSYISQCQAMSVLMTLISCPRLDCKPVAVAAALAV